MKLLDYGLSIRGMFLNKHRILSEKEFYQLNKLSIGFYSRSYIHIYKHGHQIISLSLDKLSGTAVKVYHPQKDGAILALQGIPFYGGLASNAIGKLMMDINKECANRKRYVSYIKEVIVMLERIHNASRNM